ncbi:MAG: hypothetical protein ACLFQT_10410 [Thiohalophilus sp.]
MKKFLLCTIAALVFSSTAAADNSLHAGAKAINVSITDEELPTGFLLKGKYFTSNDMAIIAGAGISINGSDADGTDISLLGGVRSYMGRGDFATFYGGMITYTDFDATNTSQLAFLGEFGGEYFVGRQFSMEGSLRAGYATTDVGALTVSSLGTFGGQVSLNYYF